MNAQCVSKKGKWNKCVRITLVILWFTVFCLLLLFVWIYFRNAGIIENFNRGNRAFQEGDFELAKTYYEAALNEKPSEKQDCRIRINEALSVTTPITPDSVTYDNLEQTIRTLEGAKDILTENGCADENDEDGHSPKAQLLKDEIDEYIEWLKENVRPPEDSDNSSDDGSSSDSDADGSDSETDEMQPSELDKLQKKMDEIQNKGLQERNRELSEYENNGDYMEYDGKNW